MGSLSTEVQGVHPQTLPEGDLIGARLSHAHLGHLVRPGRALLNPGNGTLTTVTVPTGLSSSFFGTRGPSAAIADCLTIVVRSVR